MATGHNDDSAGRRIQRQSIAGNLDPQIAQAYPGAHRQNRSRQRPQGCAAAFQHHGLIQDQRPGIFAPRREVDAGTVRLRIQLRLQFGRVGLSVQPDDFRHGCACLMRPCGGWLKRSHSPCIAKAPR